MSAEGSLVGRIAFSLAGRDKGRAFFIVGEENGHVLLADGSLRKLDRPKKKKCRHIRVEQQVAETIGSRLLEGGPVLDSELRAALLELGYKLQ